MASILNTPPDWAAALGTFLSGGYQLTALVSTEGNSALFRVSLVDNPAAQGFARLLCADSADSMRQLEIWQAVARASHPHLLHILSTGETRVGPESAVYAVTQGADESLPSVLKQRSLTADEAGAVFESLVPALECLHSSRLVHGRVSPAEVYAAGETIKISAECANLSGPRTLALRGAPPYQAPEQQGENTTPKADIWCLGATLFETLTQERFHPKLEETARLPEPFKRIVRRCVDPNPSARPSLPELQSLYQSNEVPQPVVPAQVLASDTNTSAVNRTPRFFLAIAGALLILLGIVFLWWKKDKPTQTPPEPLPDAKTISREVSPAPPASAVHVDVTHTLGNPLPSTHGVVWRLVLWTYKDPSNAQSKADALKVLYPDLHPEVFTPNPDAAYSLVVAGGAMSHDQAKETQRQARQLGLPHDCYIQNFNH